MKIINVCDNIENFATIKNKFLNVDVQDIIKEIEKYNIEVLFEIYDTLIVIKLNSTLSSIFLNEKSLYWYLVGVWNGQILRINN